ncbi:MAG: glycosyltransferase family 9 protein [Vibrionaceae bacterium]|nr:glycosyltransferase family 9 protein [Vibrionaceae bacterium]
MNLFTSPPSHLCVLRLSAIGDVCHAISVVQEIQKHWPQTKITWITGKIEAQLIGDLPDINVIVFDKSQGLKGMKAVWGQLKGIQFDGLLHMQAALRSSILSLGIKAKYKVGFSKNRTREGQWWFTNRHLPNTTVLHVLDNMAEFAKYIGVPFNKPTWNIPLPSEAVDYAKTITQGKKCVVISAAASKDSRNWLVERYAAIADYASSRGLHVVLCGSPAVREKQLAHKIESLCEQPVTNIVGETSLKQLTAILREAAVVISPDSGPAHLATTQMTPVIGLYAHSDPRRTGPYNDLDNVVSVYQQYVEEQQGQPVESLAWGTRAKGDNLMAAITVEQVQEKLENVLESLS